MKVLITKVDLYGFQGRAFHPSGAHEGLTATVFKVYSETYDDGALLDDELAEQQARDGSHEDYHVVVFYEAVIDETGQVVTLADHEVEVINDTTKHHANLIEAAMKLSAALKTTTVPVNQWSKVAYELQFLDMALKQLKRGL